MKTKGIQQWTQMAQATYFMGILLCLCVWLRFRAALERASVIASESCLFLEHGCGCRRSNPGAALFELITQGSVCCIEPSPTPETGKLDEGLAGAMIWLTC
jgi:hypothetical protein